jgi:hypothetical protein
MTSLQIATLAILACCLFTIIGSFAGMILYNLPLLSNVQPPTSTSHPIILSPTARPSLTPSLVSHTATPTITLTPTETAAPTFTPTSTVTNTPSLPSIPSRAELNAKYSAIDPLVLYSHPNDYKGKRFRITGIIVAMEQFDNSDKWLIQIAPDLHEPPGQIISRHPIAVTNFLYDRNLSINMQITVYGVGDGYVTGTIGIAPVIIMEYYYY